MKRRENGQIAKAVEYSKSEYEELLRERLSVHSERDVSGCIVWLGSKTKRGYGQIRLRNPSNRLMLAHRLAWILAGNTIPDGFELCHKCDNPRCIHVDHLFLGTRSDNVADMVSKGRNPDLAGEKSARSKLTSDQVAEICRRCEDGETQVAVAAKFGIHPAHVSRLVNRKRWPERARVSKLIKVAK